MIYIVQLKKSHKVYVQQWFIMRSRGNFSDLRSFKLITSESSVLHDKYNPDIYTVVLVIPLGFSLNLLFTDPYPVGFYPSFFYLIDNNLLLVVLFRSSP